MARSSAAAQARAAKSSISGKAPEVFIPAPQFNPHYNPMFQGPGTNRLVSLGANRNRESSRVDPVTGQLTITRGDLTVFINTFNRQAGPILRVSTFKLLDICALALTGINTYRPATPPHTSVSIDLDDYMRICGIPDTKPSKDRLRRKIKEDLETLYNISLEWSEPIGGGTKTADYAKMRIITSQGIKKGRIFVNFSTEMASYLAGAYLMQYPMEVLKIDERNPAAYHLGRKLALHHSMDSNQNAGTANIISVKSLLASAPDIPSHQEVAKSGRQFEQRIVQPFEKAMDLLTDLLTSWEYCNSKGAPLSDQQAAGFDYAVFRECFIHFELVSPPNQTARLLSKTEPQKHTV